MKKTNWFISILIFSPILFLLIYILITPLLDRKSVTDLYLDTITKKEFHGILDKIYKDPKNHNTLTVCSNKTCYTIPAIGSHILK